ncbi:uncharacterized protein LOC117166847 [Belonocnema kinseyi]|uniref:uncharacterized protein LOC117166847 n=1 Tax=Belonocnema kinseyi TaxID=2817044 RepID=UPI00143DF7DD|nr:uncharacterized protein LOC117166847 [Belonocnema kinseyi]
MLNFSLCFLDFLAIATAFTVDVNRTYFYLSPNGEQNTYTKSNLPQGLSKDSKDVDITWKEKLDLSHIGSWTPKFTIYYIGKNATVHLDTFSLKGPYATSTMEDLALTFFNHIMAGGLLVSNEYICKGKHNSPGHLQWNRNYAKGVYCEIPVKVTLEIESIPWFFGSTYPIMKAIYEGYFKKDGDYCPNN